MCGFREAFDLPIYIITLSSNILKAFCLLKKKKKSISLSSISCLLHSDENDPDHYSWDYVFIHVSYILNIIIRN